MSQHSSRTLTFLARCLVVFCFLPGLVFRAPIFGSSGIANLNRQSASESDADRIAASARESLAAGRLDEAISRAETLLQKAPGNRAAAEIKVSARVKQRLFKEALSAYDSYVASSKKPDADMLALIARGDLEQIAAQEQKLSAAALERLAGTGDREALATLKRMAKTSSGAAEAIGPVLGLARLGDKDAVAMLGTRLDTTAAESRNEILRLIQESGVQELGARAAAYLSDPLPHVRAAAARTVGALQFQGAVPRLQELFRDDVAVVKMFAAAALMRLGETSADAYLAGILASDVPEVRLIAAEAYQSSTSRQWIPRLKELLSDRNEVNRIRAAELLACCDQPAARSALVSALNADNPSMRGEAARILERTGLADLAIARRLMADGFSSVRIHGAGVALRQIKPASAAR